MRNRTVIATAVSVGGLILITVILILIVVIIVVVVKYRQQSKLLNFKIKKDEHWHIGLGKLHIVKNLLTIIKGHLICLFSLGYHS